MLAYTGMPYIFVEQFFTFKILLRGFRVWEVILQRHPRNKMLRLSYHPSDIL